MTEEFPRFIESRHGALFLMEYFPADASPDTWVIALNSGLQCRTGPRRLYVHIARHLAQCGFGVLTVDLPGVGDSDGPQLPIDFDMHDPQDVDCIIDHIVREYAPRNIVLVGLCAGARVAIKSAHRNRNVSSVIALSMPTFSSSPGTSRSVPNEIPTLSKSLAADKVYRFGAVFRERKFMRLSFWYEHARPKTAAKEFHDLCLSAWRLFVQRKKETHLGHFMSVLRETSTRSDRVFFIYGDLDKILLAEFKELELNILPEQLEVIVGGTHTFSTYVSHREVIERIEKWISSRYPRDVQITT